MNKRFVQISIVLIAMSIILGAFGAHALKERLPIDKLASFETGVRYQMYIGILLFVLSLHPNKMKINSNKVFWFFLVGCILFSGSIYVLAVQGLFGWNWNFLGPITPIGGLLLIVGCILLFLEIGRNSNER